MADLKLMSLDSSDVATNIEDSEGSRIIKSERVITSSVQKSKPAQKRKQSGKLVKSCCSTLVRGARKLFLLFLRFV